MNNPYLTCKYIEDISSGFYIQARCNASGKTCGLIRYCNTKNNIVMSDNYNKYGCNIENDYKEGSESMTAKKKEEIVETTNENNEELVEFAEEDKNEENIKSQFYWQICQVRMIKNEVIFFDFVDSKNNDTYTLTLNDEDGSLKNKITDNKIKIKFEGNIGDTEFKYSV